MSSGESSIQLFCKLCHSDDTCGTYDISDLSLVLICTGRHTCGTSLHLAQFRMPLLECKIHYSGGICTCANAYRPSSRRGGVQSESRGPFWRHLFFSSLTLLSCMPRRLVHPSWQPPLRPLATFCHDTPSLRPSAGKPSAFLHMQIDHKK